MNWKVFPEKYGKKNILIKDNSTFFKERKADKYFYPLFFLY